MTKPVLKQQSLKNPLHRHTVDSQRFNPLQTLTLTRYRPATLCSVIFLREDLGRGMLGRGMGLKFAVLFLCQNIPLPSPAFIPALTCNPPRWSGESLSEEWEQRKKNLQNIPLTIIPLTLPAFNSNLEPSQSIDQQFLVGHDPVAPFTTRKHENEGLQLAKDCKAIINRGLTGRPGETPSEGTRKNAPAARGRNIVQNGLAKATGLGFNM